MIVILCDICGGIQNFNIDISTNKEEALRIHLCNNCCKRFRLAFLKEFQKQIEDGWECNGIKRNIKDECNGWADITK